MAIPTEKAYELLNLPLGASKDCIEQSYKKMAFKWHPEKYTNTKSSNEALKKFKLINIAYRKLLNNERDDKDLSLHEMFDQYRQVFNKKSNSHTSSARSGNEHINHKNISKSPLEVNNRNNFSRRSQNEPNTNSWIKSASNKSKQNHLVYDKNNNNEENHYQQGPSPASIATAESVQSLKIKVKSLAIKGNEYAKQGEFQKAIDKFTEAIRYECTDHRLYGNRSYCFDKIGMFQEALSDAEKAIYLEPNWPKGYFRKGRALSGLQMYKEAEQSYTKVLEFENSDDPELDEELSKVRAFQLQEMGFSRTQSEVSIKSHGTVKAALEAIFVNTNVSEAGSDLDDTEYEFAENDADSEADSTSDKSYKKIDKTNFNSSSSSTSSSSSSSTTTTTSSNNNESYTGCEHGNNSSGSSTSTVSSQITPSTSLWIGNVDPGVTEEMLSDLFGQHGPLANVRCLPEKYCAFVNFKVKEDAQKAMQILQGKPLEGQRLLIKYPDNPNTVLLSSLVTKKCVVSDVAKKSSPDQKTQQSNKKKHDEDCARSAAALEAAKLSGPVNGNECYFWRTTGCLYADKCRYEHLKKSKGIDKKPWHKQ